MKGRRLAVSITVVVAACTVPGSNPEVEGSATTPSSTTTLVAAPTTSSVSPEIVFAAVDRGVLTHLEFVDRTDGLQPEPTGSGGDGVRLTDCRITWFGQYEFEFEWTPDAESTGGPVRTVIDLGFLVGDMGWGVATVDVELDGPGHFVVPLSNLDVFHVEGDEETTANPQVIDDTSSFACMAILVPPESEAADPMMTAPITVEVKPPDPLHPVDSIQGIVERMDPTDGTEPYRPLAALAAYFPQFPVDVVYVVPDGVVDSMTLEIEGACLTLSSAYRDGTYITQHTGCLDGGHPGMPVDDVWAVDSPENVFDQLQPLRWWGHPGVMAITDKNEYLDQRDLPEGATEIYRTEVLETLVSVVRHEADDGSLTFEMEGVGDNSGGGGFPGEVWAGCYQVQYRDSGYSLIVVQDPSWAVTADGQQVEMVDAGDVGVAVVPFVVNEPSQLEIESANGERPDCLDAG